MKVLVLAPHPDDEILGCGGSMAKHIRSGDQVVVAIVTKGQGKRFKDELIAIGRREAKESHQYLGVAQTIFLDLPAIQLDTIPQYEINDTLLNLLKQIDPEILYIPNEFDVNSDHRIIHEAAIVATRPVYKNNIKRILAYETLSATEWIGPSHHKAFIPNVYNDISMYINQKIKAMQLYKSQLREFPHSRSLEAIKVLAKWRGLAVGEEYVEAFRLIKELT